MPVETVDVGTCIVRQGDTGDHGFVVLQGSVEVYKEETDAHGNLCSDRHSLEDMTHEIPMVHSPSRSSSRRGALVRTMVTGRFFGELSMLWNSRRTRSIYAKETCVLAKLHREVYQNLVVRREMSTRESKESC